MKDSRVIAIYESNLEEFLQKVIAVMYEDRDLHVKYGSAHCNRVGDACRFLLDEFIDEPGELKERFEDDPKDGQEFKFIPGSTYWL